MDFFFNKAPSTLLKRCNSLARLVNHLNKAGGCCPFTEQDLYEFLRFEKSGGAPASRLKALLESLNFCRRVLGVYKI